MGRGHTSDPYLVAGRQRLLIWTGGIAPKHMPSLHGDSKLQEKKCLHPGLVVHVFNPQTQEIEECRPLSSRSIWSTEQASGQPSS